jgi:hypothetical protein
MNKKLMFAGIVTAASLLFSSCVDPYYNSGYDNYGGGGYPRNSVEAALPIIAGAALVGAIIDNNSGHHGRNYSSGHYGGAYQHCPPPRYGW